MLTSRGLPASWRDRSGKSAQIMVSPGWDFSPPGLVLSPQRRRFIAGDLEFGKRTCKPNSVVCGHSSRRSVSACAHQRPTRRLRQLSTPATKTCRRGPRYEPPGRIGQMRSAARLLGFTRFRGASLPIWSCSVWGLPCLRRYRRSGALLPHLFTLTPAGLAVQGNLKGLSGSPAGRERRGRGSRGGMFSVALAVRGL